MAQPKVYYQKLQSLKSKVFDINRDMEKIKIEATKLVDPYNKRIAELEKECIEYLKKIEEEESKIKK